MTQDYLDNLIRDLTKVGPMPKSEVRRRLEEYRNLVIDDCVKTIGTFTPTCGYGSEEEKGYQNGLIAEENLIKKQLSSLQIRSN